MKSCENYRYNETSVFHNQNHITKIRYQKSYRIVYISENKANILSNKNTLEKIYNKLFLGSHGILHIDNKM